MARIAKVTMFRGEEVRNIGYVEVDKDLRPSELFSVQEGIIKKALDAAGIEGITKIGYCRAVFENGTTFSTWKGEACQPGSEYRSRNEFIISTTRQKDAVEHSEPSEINGEKVPDLFFEIDIFQPGFVLAAGKKDVSLLGAVFDRYVLKMTSRCLRTASLAGAKVFKDPAAVLKELQTKKDLFSYFVRVKGYFFSMERASFLSMEYLNGHLSDKQKAAQSRKISEVDEILSGINHAGEPAEPVRLYGRTQEEEAVLRLHELDVHPDVMKALTKGVLFQSINGCLYEHPEKESAVATALNKVRDKGYLPYHVLRRGPYIAVLYVTPVSRSDEWETERFDLRSGGILAYVYNSESPEFSERGDIFISPGNGGGLSYIT